MERSKEMEKETERNEARDGEYQERYQEAGASRDITEPTMWCMSPSCRPSPRVRIKFISR